MEMDTAAEQLRNELRQLYADGSKHSVYQNVPAFVSDALGYTEKIDELWRGDTARYQYLVSRLDLAGQAIVDVGANTGFFALSLAHRCRDARVTAVEGNPNHASFIRRIAALFEMSNVEVRCAYADYAGSLLLPECDTMLLLNILHHAGVDFDLGMVAQPSALADYVIEYLGRIKMRTRRVVFQMGYHWGGNKQRPIVPLAQDAEKIVYTSGLFRACGWTIRSVAVARPTDQPPFRAYDNLPETVVEALNVGAGLKPARIVAAVESALPARLPELSEFYRRPLLVCERRAVDGGSSCART